MKNGIHPTYFTNTKVTCACGNSFVTGSTKEAITVEICSQCHPFYTGKQKLIDTTGTVDRFKKRAERGAVIAAKKTEKKPRKTKAEKEAK